MQPAKTTIAAIRYGFGFRPGQGAPQDADMLLDQLLGRDQTLSRKDPKTFEEAFQVHADIRAAAKLAKQGDADAPEKRQKALRTYRRYIAQSSSNFIMQPLLSENGFRERLVLFWLDHFTIIAKNRRLSLLLEPYVNEAIRPHINRSFSDLLVAATLHPAMMVFLDQVASAGPNSRIAQNQRGNRQRGLNENLARELLELHTLGVDGAYSQQDVRQLALLLTGLRVNAQGLRFARNWAEPGTFEILGNAYGGRRPGLQHIEQFLQDIAIHPTTARHIAQKLAVHFITDTPPKDLVDSMTRAFIQSDGDLMQLYKAMLAHPAAWTGFGEKVKPPLEYMVSTLRALGVEQQDAPTNRVRRFIAAPLQLMGQPLGRPDGPDGWPEKADAWITPQRLAGRVQWSMEAARQFGASQDVASFGQLALADAMSAETAKWARRAENKTEAIALILASPEFNRR